MRKFIVFASICIAILQSCGTSSNVRSNFSIQKRKYTNGWNVKDLFIRNQTAEESKAENSELTAKVETQKPDETNQEARTVHFNSTNDREIEVTIESATSTDAEIQEDNVEVERSNPRLNSIEKVESPSENDDPEKNTTSPELKKFNLYHNIILWMFTISLISILAAIFAGFASELLIPFLILSIPMYVLVIKQRNKNAKNVPETEKDAKFQRKKKFADVLYVIGTILVIVSIILLIAGIFLFLSFV